MKVVLATAFLFISVICLGQDFSKRSAASKVRFKYIEPKFHFGSFMKSDNALGESGLLDNGYGGITVKMGWQPSDTALWAARYGYPSYGVGFYSGFLSDEAVFGNPNAIFGFIKFSLSRPSRRNIFSIEPSLGLAYKFVPYNEVTNPINTAIGAHGAVYFNLDFGFTYQWTREMDVLYGVDFTHFSNGSTFQPNAGLNLYGFTVGLRYNYNKLSSRRKSDIYRGDSLPARFRRLRSKEALPLKQDSWTVYFAGGVAQNKQLAGTHILKSTLTTIVDYEHRITEKHGITGGADIFYDDRLQHKKAFSRWSSGVHVGYDFYFYRFAMKMQVGTYLTNDRGKGAFFMRPALRYHFSKRFFAQVGLKTLDGGAADYIETGIGWRSILR